MENNNMEKEQQNTPQPEQKRKKAVVGYILFGLLYVLAVVIFVLVAWSRREYNVSLNEMVYTITSPLRGNDGGVVEKVTRECLPLMGVLLLPYIAFVVADCLVKKQRTITLKKGGKERGHMDFIRTVAFILCVALFLGSVVYANAAYNLVGYIASQFDQTTIYEDEYVDPKTVHIMAPEQKKNLLYIYLESMETAYASQNVGGNQEQNLIPYLTQLAQENISFSNTETLGGFRPLTGITWTMGALFATGAGVPYAFPVERNSMSKYENFASGITALGDILEKEGYNQVFLCGSDAEFGGREYFFQQHGNFAMHDLFTAREEGYIPEDYKVWWGYEDEYLYKIAKDQLTKLSSQEEPFNLTMLTVDTHFPDGYTCNLCSSEYDSVAANVVACADHQLQQFLEWCKTQPFYEDTLIVVVGDHPRMDTKLVEGIEYKDRTMYNCFLNSGFDKETLNTTNRDWSAVDMFPTVLAGLGFRIKDNHLGLGVNMFSEEKTLIEEMGYEALEAELQKQSNYYVQTFQ